MKMPNRLACIIPAIALGGCTVFADKTCWNAMIPDALEDAADFEKGVWTISDDGVLTASQD